MDPDLTRPEHTFDTQKIRGQPVFGHGTFRPNPKRFFLTQREKFGIFREIFQSQSQTKDG